MKIQTDKKLKCLPNAGDPKVMDKKLTLNEHEIMIQIYTIQIYIWSKKIYGHAECDKIHLHTKTKKTEKKIRNHRNILLLP